LALRPSRIGSVRIPFESVTHVCQVNDDLQADRPVKIVVVGRKQGQAKQSAAVISIDH